MKAASSPPSKNNSQNGKMQNGSQLKLCNIGEGKREGIRKNHHQRNKEKSSTLKSAEKQEPVRYKMN